MRRVTQRDVEDQFAVLVLCLRQSGVPCDDWELSRWAPGDGQARYRVESDGGARHPLGANYWLGAGEAYASLRTAAYSVGLVNANAGQPA